MKVSVRCRVGWTVVDDCVRLKLDAERPQNVPTQSDGNESICENLYKSLASVQIRVLYFS